MAALVEACTLLMRHCVLPDCDAAALLTRVAGAMLQQALERISRLRESAATSLLRLLQAQVRFHPLLVAVSTLHTGTFACALLTALQPLHPNP